MRIFFIMILAGLTMPVSLAMASVEAAPITLEQVVVKVLQQSPQMIVGDYDIRAAAERIEQLRQGPAAEVKVEFGNVFGSGVYRGVDRVETTLSVAKVLELGGRARLRGALAESQSDVVINEQDSRRMDLLAGAAEKFLQVVAYQQRLKISQEQLLLMQQTHEIAQQRVKAGRSHVAEQRRTAIAVSRAEIEVEHVEHELAAHRLALATRWGDRWPVFGSAEANLYELPAIERYEKIETLLVNNPDLIRLANEKRVAQAQLYLAQSRRSPLLELSAGIRHLNQTDDGVLILSANMPFGSAARAKSYIREAEYLQQREPYRYEQQHLILHSTLFGLYQEMLHAKTAFEVINRHIILQAENVARDYEQGYAQGRFSLLELHQAQQGLIETRLELLETATNYHRLRIEIERLTGAEIGAGVKS